MLVSLSLDLPEPLLGQTGAAHISSAVVAGHVVCAAAVPESFKVKVISEIQELPDESDARRVSKYKLNK